MGFIKALIRLVILAVVIIFAFVNNDFANFNLWPFYIEVTVSLSVAIVFFVAFGFIWGKFDSWMGYAPVRSQLRRQKKQNKKLSKEQQKLLPRRLPIISGPNVRTAVRCFSPKSWKKAIMSAPNATIICVWQPKNVWKCCLTMVNIKKSLCLNSKKTR